MAYKHSQIDLKPLCHTLPQPSLLIHISQFAYPFYYFNTNHVWYPGSVWFVICSCIYCNKAFSAMQFLFFFSHDFFFSKHYLLKGALTSYRVKKEFTQHVLQYFLVPSNIVLILYCRPFWKMIKMICLHPIIARHIQTKNRFLFMFLSQGKENLVFNKWTEWVLIKVRYSPQFLCL